MLLPPHLPRRDIQLAEWATVRQLRVLDRQARHLLGVILVLRDMERVMAPWALPDLALLLADPELVVVVVCDFDDLVAVLAGGEHRAVAPLVDVEVVDALKVLVDAAAPAAGGEVRGFLGFGLGVLALERMRMRRR